MYVLSLIIHSGKSFGQGQWKKWLPEATLDQESKL